MSNTKSPRAFIDFLVERETLTDEEILYELREEYKRVPRQELLDLIRSTRVLMGHRYK